MTNKKITPEHLISTRFELIKAKVKQEIVTKDDLKEGQNSRVKWYAECIHKSNN